MGKGDDFALGGAGWDKFVIEASSGHDFIGDFEINIDKIVLTSLGVDNFSELRALMTEGGGNTFIDFDSSNSINLQGVSIASLDQNDFIFIA